MRSLTTIARAFLVLAAISATALGATVETSAITLNTDDVNAWLDGYMPYALHTGDIAGAVVAVVKDGKILTERGYGYSDVAKRTPVDPKLTLFRPGSVSKLVTWTAVMQLVEQGKIDLDADVNQYLDFKIPARDGKPVTMRNLMQHIAGFEEQAKGIMSEDPKAPTFEALLKTMGTRAGVPSRDDARLLQLRRFAGRLHRAAGVGRDVRRLHREAYFRTARHEAFDLPPAAAGADWCR